MTFPCQATGSSLASYKLSLLLSCWCGCLAEVLFPSSRNSCAHLLSRSEKTWRSFSFQASLQTKVGLLPFPYLLSLDPLLSISDSCECLLASEGTHLYTPCGISTTTLKQKKPTSVVVTHLVAESVPSSHLFPNYKKKRQSLFVMIQSWLNVDKFSSRNTFSFMR